MHFWRSPAINTYEIIRNEKKNYIEQYLNNRQDERASL